MPPAVADEGGAMHITGRVPGAKYIWQTDDIHVVVVKFSTWASWVNPEAQTCVVVDSRDPNTIVEAKFSLLTNTAKCHMHLANRAIQELEAWYEQVWFC